MKPVVRLLLFTAATALLAGGCAPPEERAETFLRKAQELYAAGDLSGARLQAKSAVQIEPKNAAARYVLALTFEQEGNLRETVGNLLLAVDGDPGNLPAQLKLGNLFFYAENFAEAERYAAAAAAIAPEDTGVRLLQARLLFQQQDTAAALARLDEILTDEPANLDALTLKSIALARDNPREALAFVDRVVPTIDADKTQALRRLRLTLLATLEPASKVEEELRNLVAHFPGEAFYQQELFRLYRNQGRLDEAEQVVRDMISRSPDNVDFRLGLVQFLAQYRSVEAADAALAAFVAEQPEVPQFTQALGRRYDATGRTAEAIALYRAYAEREPRSAAGLATRREIAILAFRDGRIEEGRAEIDAILQDVPDDPPSLILRASLSADAGNDAEAIADLRSALRRQPESQGALLQLARTYVRAGNPTLAADTYRQLLAVNPRHPEAPGELAPLLASQGDLASTAALLEKQIAANPDDILSLGRLAELRLQEREPAAAETLARRIMAISNQQGLGEFVLGRALLAQGQAPAAVTAFRTALAARPGDLLVREGLVQALVAGGKVNEAIQQLDADLAARPDDSPALYLLGSLYARQGDAARARQLLQGAIAIEPTAATYYEGLAQLEDSPEARIRLYQQGLKELPGHPALALRLGESHAQAGQVEDAIQAFEGALATNPGYLPAANNLAALLLDHRDDRNSWQRALLLAGALEVTRDPLYLDTLGWAKYRNEDYPGAVRTLERAVALNGGIAVLRYHLGMAYLAAGNDAGARQEFEEAVALAAASAPFPGLEEARQALARLAG